MQNHEIRIWGNSDQFQEFTVAKSSAGLLESADVERLGFKRFQAWQANMFYSVFFGRECYLLCCHFLATRNTTAKLNHRMTTVAIVLRRGHKVTNALAAVKRLYFLYLTFLEKNAVADPKTFNAQLIKRVTKWEEEMADDVAKADGQMLVNREAFTNRGYVTYTLEEQLQNFFDEPMRIDFKGACQIVFLHSNMAQKFSSVLVDQHFTPVQAVSKYQKKYALYFPDYNPQQPILLISSLDELFVHTFERPGYKPIALSGRLSDHIDDWFITESEDKTSYSIGLVFEREESKSPGGTWARIVVLVAVFALGLLIGYAIGQAGGNTVQ